MGRPGPNFEPFGFVLDLCWTIDEAFLAHLGTLLVLSRSLLGQTWIHSRTQMVSYFNSRCNDGSKLGPSWIHRGFPPSIHDGHLPAHHGTDWFLP